MVIHAYDGRNMYPGWKVMQLGNSYHQEKLDNVTQFLDSDKCLLRE